MDHLNEKTLREYLQDQLDDKQAQDVDSHLRECASCCASLASIVDSTTTYSDKEPDRTVETAQTNPDVQHSPPVTAPQFEIGHRFMILEELARGGMGIVYRGYDRELNREIAIKVLREGFAEATHRFYREAQVLGQFQHPGIVPIYECGWMTDRRMFIAMKLVKGKTLNRLFDQKDTSERPADLLGIFAQLCEAVAYAHARGFVHRDLKPENIMLGNFGEIQIMDWGLAKKLTPDGLVEQQVRMPDSITPVSTPSSFPIELQPTDSKCDTITSSPLSTQLGAVFGTPAYMPPEQALGQSVDLRTDVFALGGILLYLLTGKAPFDAPTKTLALDKTRSRYLAAAISELREKNFDTGLVAIAESCLAENLDDRPSDAGVVSKMLGRYLEARETEFEENRIERARSAERLLAQQRRSRQVVWFSAAIIATLLATATAATAYLMEKNRRQSEQAEIALDNQRRLSDAENKIRANLVSAKRFRELALDPKSPAAGEHWQAALFEIKQAKTHVDLPLAGQLISEIKHTGQEISDQADRFFQAKTQKQQELACAQQLRIAVHQSLYPPSLRQALIGRLTETFSDAFAKIGVQSGDVSNQSADRIWKSEHQAIYLHALMVWQVEVAREARRFGPKPDDMEIRKWLLDLLTLAERDPFRIELRKAIDCDRDMIAPLMRKPESAQTLSSVLLCTLLIEYIKVPSEKTDFLLRAQQTFPDEFIVRWKLSAVNGLEDDSKKELGLRSALACNALQPENPAVLMNLGATYIQQENYGQAIEALEQVVRLAPNFADARYNLANACWRNGDPSSALSHCQTILKTAPDNYMAMLLKAMVNQELGNVDNAIRDYQSAVAIDKKQITAVYKLHEVAKTRKRFDEAIQYLERVIEIAPNHTIALKDLSRLYVRTKQWESAESTFKKMLQISPKDATTLASLANLYLTMKRPADSEALLRDAIFNGVNSHAMQLELAKSLLQQNAAADEPIKREEGLRILRGLTRLAPSMHAPKKILQRYEN